jgi:hypothetical protein
MNQNRLKSNQPKPASRSVSPISHLVLAEAKKHREEIKINRKLQNTIHYVIDHWSISWQVNQLTSWANHAWHRLHAYALAAYGRVQPINPVLLNYFTIWVRHISITISHFTIMLRYFCYCIQSFIYIDQSVCDLVCHFVILQLFYYNTQSFYYGTYSFYN